MGRGALGATPVRTHSDKPDNTTDDFAVTILMTTWSFLASMPAHGPVRNPIVLSCSMFLVLSELSGAMDKEPSLK